MRIVVELPETDQFDRLQNSISKHPDEFDYEKLENELLIAVAYHRYDFSFFWILTLNLISSFSVSQTTWQVKRVERNPKLTF